MGAGGLLLAAPSSGSGKTLITLALLRALRRDGLKVASGKSGPDYIDPRFHEAASGSSCINLDAWAMRPEFCASLFQQLFDRSDLVLVEGAMGLFDGALDGSGSSADLAQILDIPIILILDAAKQGQTLAAVAEGLIKHRKGMSFAGVILNRVGSPRHEALLRQALEPIGLPILAVLPKNPALAMPERHLGLVQAQEHGDLEAFLETAADWVSAQLDKEALLEAARRAKPRLGFDEVSSLAPLAQRIAVARDEAFAFSYPHQLESWRRAGAELCFFSPLADEAPDPTCGAIFLPGGYPELHAARLGGNATFLQSLRGRADQGALIYGECGGFMVLGERLEDAQGQSHRMAGLLDIETSFAKRKLHLGYRKIKPLAALPWGEALRGHEFHYASILREGQDQRLFQVEDAAGAVLGPVGLRRGSVMGSFIHVVDAAA